VALNPTLIGLNAQATNDSFVIFFGTLSIERACEFFRTGRPGPFVLMGAAVTLAALSKGNGLVVFVAVTATLALALLRSPVVAGVPRRRLARMTVAFMVVSVTTVAALGAYRSNWVDAGSPFAINGDPAPMPHLLQRTYVYRPGTTSIADTYLTFRFVDMLRNPAISGDPLVYPMHRTSLWSQLYGRAHAVHFAQHPPSWQNDGMLVVTLTRLIFLVALVPTLFLLAGIVRAAGTLLGAARRGVPASGERLADELVALTALGYVAFVVVYSLTYRDFSTMKAEFLFPGLLAYVVLAVGEVERAETSWLRRPAVRRVVFSAFALLLALYVADVLILAVQLT
jgi:hypothetical protein